MIMSKKTNTVLFIIGGTAFNIIITVLSFIILLVLYGSLLLPRLPEGGGTWGIPVIFIVSIVVSFLAYRLLIKIIMKKVDMEKHFDPIFGPRRPRKQ